MHVVVNAAVSADGKLASCRREQLTISGPEDFERVDALRADCDGVMVGVGTVLADDPRLTTGDEGHKHARRERGAPDQPARVIADSHARTPPDSHILDDTAATYVLVGECAPAPRCDALEAAGARIIVAGTEESERVNLPAALAALEHRGLDSLLVEGGGELLFSVFSAGLADELSVFVGSLLVGGRDAPTLADGEGFVGEFPELVLEGVERLDDGVVLSYECP